MTLREEVPAIDLESGNDILPWPDLPEGGASGRDSCKIDLWFTRLAMFGGGTRCGHENGEGRVKETCSSPS